MAALFRLRNFLVRFVGLKGEEGMDVAEFERAIREGGSYGFSSVAAQNGHDIRARELDGCPPITPYPQKSIPVYLLYRSLHGFFFRGGRTFFKEVQQRLSLYTRARCEHRDDQNEYSLHHFIVIHF